MGPATGQGANLTGAARNTCIADQGCSGPSVRLSPDSLEAGVWPNLVIAGMSEAGMNRRCFAVMAVAAVVGGAGVAIAADAPTNWDGLTLVNSTKLQYVYLLPGADFSRYTKVMLDPTEISFKKNWARDYNNSTMRSLSHRITDADVERVVQEGGKT